MTTPHRIEHFLPLGVLGVALTLRVLWICIVPAVPFAGHDFHWYLGQAQNLAAGNSYAVNGHPTACWPVGYPFFGSVLLRIFGSGTLSLKVANAVFGTLSVSLVFVLSIKWFQSRRVALIAMSIMALYPNHIAYSSLIASEPLALSLMLYGVVMLEWRRWLAAGLLLGFACLVKTQIVLIPALWLTHYFVTQHQKRIAVAQVIAVMIAMCLVILPWTYRNYHIFGKPVFVSSNGGINLLIGNNPYASGAYMDMDALPKKLGINAPNEIAMDQACRQYAVRYALNHPVNTISLWPKKLKELLWGYTDGIRFNERSLSPEANHRLRALLWFSQKASVFMGISIMLCGIIGILLAIVKRLRHAEKVTITLMPAGFFLILASVHILMFGDTRYQYPLIPFLVMYASWLLSQVSLRHD